MHQFVQSAIEAAKQGDNDKALEFLKQVLDANPNDVDAWLVLAAVVDDPQHKRQCLKRALALDPVNQVARDELLEMDRAEMGDPPLFMPELDPVSTDTYNPNLYLHEELPATKQHIPTLGKTSAKKEKTLVFKYPLLWRAVMYFLTVVFVCAGLLMFAVRQGIVGLFFLGVAVLALLGAFAFSSTVEVSREGIRAYGVFSSAETGWDEIAKMKSNAMKRRLELIKRGGEMVNVSTQVEGYARIKVLLQKRRPDLLDAASEE